MYQIRAYKAVDGQIFEDEDKAIAHDEDCIGMEIDGLITGAVNACNGNVTRNDRFKMVTYLLKNRAETKKAIDILYHYLNADSLPGALAT